MDLTLKEIFDGIQCVAVITASSVAIYGIDSWRKESRWKRKYELAEEALSLFYQVHQDIRTIRSPFGFGGEGKSRAKGENETKEESEIYDRQYVVMERYNQNKTALEKLQALKFRFSVVFGRNNEKHFDEVTKIFNEMFFAYGRIADFQLEKLQSVDENNLRELLIESRQVMYSHHDSSKDPIEQRLVKLISEIEVVCKDIIGRDIEIKNKGE
jgi:hypothetical protein